MVIGKEKYLRDRGRGRGRRSARTFGGNWNASHLDVGRQEKRWVDHFTGVLVVMLGFGPDQQWRSSKRTWLCTLASVMALFITMARSTTT